MRRTLLLASAVAATLMLSACNNSSTSPASSSAPAGAAVPAAEATAPAGPLSSFDVLDQAKGFHVGKGANTGRMPAAYVLFDPQCSHCAELWQRAKPLQADVLVKWIPIGMLNRTSVIQAAMLLETSDPVAMMSKNEDEFVATHRASKVTADVKTETIRMVEQNTGLLETLKSRSVPTIIYRDRTTQGPAITAGALPTEQLAHLFGVTPQAAVANPSK